MQGTVPPRISVKECFSGVWVIACEIKETPVDIRLILRKLRKFSIHIFKFLLQNYRENERENYRDYFGILNIHTSGDVAGNMRVLG